MSAEVWDQVYDRLAKLIEGHRTTLIFVNTRRMGERVTRKLSDRLGEAGVAAHHGSLAKEQRLDAEQRLKAGALSAMVATSSLELFPCRMTISSNARRSSIVRLAASSTG